MDLMGTYYKKERLVVTKSVILLQTIIDIFCLPRSLAFTNGGLKLLKHKELRASDCCGRLQSKMSWVQSSSFQFFSLLGYKVALRQ